ncbi:MAG: DUF4147 domain-containing protein [Bacteroidetes bacterium]|nr:DUF4147 domain-containing protein [Bacteroidota bacterium]
MNINNIESIREDIQYLFKKGIESVLPENLFKNYLSLSNNILQINSINHAPRCYDLNLYKNIYVVGAGKASTSMAKALENLLLEKITKGIIVTKYGFLENLNKIKIIEAAHPVPDDNSVLAAKEILSIVNSAGKDDLIINLISGGASSLLTLPVDGISLNDKIKTTTVLLNNEASIHEINTIRKCLSQIKGGGLIARSQATFVSLIISDVIGDDINIIASGPTSVSFPDYSSAVKIINKYNLYDLLPDTVISYLNNKCNTGAFIENIPQIDNENFLIGNNDTAINEIINSAEKKGYNTYKIDKKIKGEVKTAAEEYFKIISNLSDYEKPLCVVSGGETTVKIIGNGLGGRNQEFCLTLIDYIKNKENIIILSGGTDGNDGPTDAAGAVIDSECIFEAESKNLEHKSFLSNNDSYTFFKKINSLIITGPTLTNVMDVQITILY